MTKSSVCNHFYSSGWGHFELCGCQHASWNSLFFCIFQYLYNIPQLFYSERKSSHSMTVPLIITIQSNPHDTCSLTRTKNSEHVSSIICHYRAVASHQTSISRFSNTNISPRTYLCKQFIFIHRCRWLCCCLFADQLKCWVHRPAAAALHTFVLRKRANPRTKRNPQEKFLLDYNIDYYYYYYYYYYYNKFKLKHC